MKNSERIILRKMIGYCNDIQSFLDRFSYNYEKYLSDKLPQYACNTCIIQLGELSARLSDEFREEHDDIPWKLIRAMRNIHAHDYENVNPSIVWETLTKDIPMLKENLNVILHNDQDSVE